MTEKEKIDEEGKGQRMMEGWLREARMVVDVCSGKGVVEATGQIN